MSDQLSGQFMPRAEMKFENLAFFETLMTARVEKNLNLWTSSHLVSSWVSSRRLKMTPRFYAFLSFGPKKMSFIIFTFCPGLFFARHFLTSFLSSCQKQTQFVSFMNGKPKKANFLHVSPYSLVYERMLDSLKRIFTCFHVIWLSQYSLNGIASPCR